jgi:hypothetical protein
MSKKYVSEDVIRDFRLFFELAPSADLIDLFPISTITGIAKRAASLRTESGDQMREFRNNEDGQLQEAGYHGEDAERWDNFTAPVGVFRKKVNTTAMRIKGPFRVHTSEGPLTCKDGWLCFDARGYPYPVADDEFQLIYEEVLEPQVEVK